MEIIKQTPTELKIRFRPWSIWIISLFFITIVMPGIIGETIGFGKTNSLTCQRSQRTQGSCQLVSKFLLRSEVKTIPLQNLQSAKYELLPDSKGKKKQRVVLLTNQGEINFSSPTQHPNWQTLELKAIASDINAFLKTPGVSSLTVTQDISPQFGIVSFFLTISLLTLAFYSEIVTCDFNKTLGIFIKQRKWFFIIKKQEIPLLEIVSVVVEERRSKGQRYYRIFLVLASGKRLPIMAYHTIYGVGQKKTQATADEIAKFLNLPPYR